MENCRLATITTDTGYKAFVTRLSPSWISPQALLPHGQLAIRAVRTRALLSPFLSVPAIPHVGWSVT